MSRKRFSNKLHIKKGDTVKVNAGDDRGKTGRVIEVFPTELRALVEGINIVSKSTKPNAQNTQGGIVKKEAPVHISNLSLVIGGKTTRVGRKVVDGKSVRVAKKTGEVIK